MFVTTDLKRFKESWILEKAETTEQKEKKKKKSHALKS